MKARSTLRPALIGIVAALASATQASAQQMPGKFPGGCAEPPKRPSEIGCYLSAIHPVAKLLDEPLFRHLYTYPTRAAAEAAKAESLSTVAESLDNVWLFTIANAQWRRLRSSGSADGADEHWFGDTSGIVPRAS